MSAPSVTVLGVYSVELTPELFANAFEIKYGGTDLTPEELVGAEGAVREEISGAVLLEVLVSNRDSQFDVGDFEQTSSGQAPYDEHFLSEDGLKVVSDGFDVPDGDTLRAAFFLHFFDPELPLKTSYGNVDVPAVQPMSARLSALVPYEPVD
jgi:hypothetical protein